MKEYIKGNDKKHEKQMAAIRDIELSLSRISLALEYLKEIRHDIKDHDRKIITMQTRLKGFEARGREAETNT